MKKAFLTCLAWILLASSAGPASAAAPAPPENLAGPPRPFLDLGFEAPECQGGWYLGGRGYDGRFDESDPQVGRRVEGQRAVYHVARRQVEIFGDPVVMSDRDGNKVRGKRALYSIDDGKVEIKGKDEAAPAAPASGSQGTGR